MELEVASNGAVESDAAAMLQYGSSLLWSRISVCSYLKCLNMKLLTIWARRNARGVSATCATDHKKQPAPQLYCNRSTRTPTVRNKNEPAPSQRVQAATLHPLGVQVDVNKYQYHCEMVYGTVALFMNMGHRGHRVGNWREPRFRFE